jgi:hypothetical protein
MDDHNVSGRVKSALNHDPVYKYEDVTVLTHNGTVQLSGWATTSDQVQRATEISERVEGVAGVINNISIKRTQTGRKEGYPYPRPADSLNNPGRTNEVDHTIHSTTEPPPAPLRSDDKDEPLPPPPNTPNR